MSVFYEISNKLTPILFQIFFNVPAIKAYFSCECTILSIFRDRFIVTNAFDMVGGNSDNHASYANHICHRLIDINVHNSCVIVSVPYRFVFRKRTFRKFVDRRNDFQYVKHAYKKRCYTKMAFLK